MKGEGLSILLVLVVSLVLLSGCLGEQFTNQINTQTPTTIKAFVCNPPYIQVGDSCCLDQNSNGICDSDEATETTQKPLPTTTIITSQQATTTTSKPTTTSTLRITTTTVKIACAKSSDCGTVTKKRVCYNNNVYEQTTTPVCANPGTPKAECKYTTSGIFQGSQLQPPLEECGERFCSGGECVGEMPTTTSTQQAASTTTTAAGPTTTIAAQGSTTTIRVTTTHPSPTTTVVIVQCGGSLHSSSNCDGQCNQACENCMQYQQTPCYVCQKDCSKLGAGWANSASCDGQHEVLEENPTCSGCYRCNEVCPEPDYYRLQGCNARCVTILCRQVKVHEPQSQYKDCYKCYPPVCGNDIIEPGEQCETDLDCPDYHYCDLDCQCATDCAGYCADQGANGYPHIPGIANKAACEADMNAKMAALNCQNQAKCGAYAWMGGLTANCCCVEVRCGPTVDACKAGL